MKKFSHSEKLIKKVRTHSEKFMEKEYPDEAPFFHIAWEIFEEVLQDTGKDAPDLKGPVVRFEGDDTIMAPVVIRAFYTIFLEFEEEIESSSGNVRVLIEELLSKNKFAPEFSARITDFLLEKRT